MGNYSISEHELVFANGSEELWVMKSNVKVKSYHLRSDSYLKVEVVGGDYVLTKDYSRSVAKDNGYRPGNVRFNNMDVIGLGDIRDCKCKNGTSIYAHFYLDKAPVFLKYKAGGGKRLIVGSDHYGEPISFDCGGALPAFPRVDKVEYLKPEECA